MLSSKLNWNLVYDMATGSWYYHSIKDGNVIDVKTLKVVEE